MYNEKFKLLEMSIEYKKLPYLVKFKNNDRIEILSGPWLLDGSDKERREIICDICIKTKKACMNIAKKTCEKKEASKQKRLF